MKGFVLDLVFPKFCVLCSKEGEWVCRECRKQVVPVVMQVCPKCGKISESGKYCEKCRKGKALSGIICSSYFEEGPVREMIHHFKYNGVIELGENLGKLMVGSFRQNLSCLSDQGNLSLTFVPLHKSRLQKRGYNQSEILATYVGKKLNIKLEHLLVKTKSTKRQVELKGKQRRKNLEGVFKLKSQNLSVLRDLSNLTVILVDDVTTTGSTLEECARVLKSAGVKEVWGLVVCRG